MKLSDLENCRVKAISRKGSYASFAQPQPVIPEGQVLRIAEMHVIPVSMVDSIEENGKVISVFFKDGGFMKLETV